MFRVPGWYSDSQDNIQSYNMYKTTDITFMRRNMENEYWIIISSSKTTRVHGMPIYIF